MFRRLSTTASCLPLAAIVFTGAASAEISADYSIDLASAYVWRGITVTDGAVFQPSITISHGNGFSFNTWGNLDIDDVNGLEGEFNEVDLTASYAFPSDSVFSAEIGLIEYLFPNSGSFSDGTRELYLGLGWDLILSPSVTLYYDFNEVDALYADFGIGFSGELEKGAQWAIDLTASYAEEDFAAFYVGGIDSGFFAGTIGASISIPAGENWGVTAFVNYADSLDTKVLPTQQVDVFGGVSISASF